jgi:hypothetical protein
MCSAAVLSMGPGATLQLNINTDVVPILRPVDHDSWPARVMPGDSASFVQQVSLEHASRRCDSRFNTLSIFILKPQQKQPWSSAMLIMAIHYH